MRLHPRTNTTNGFTLVEVAVSTCILVIGLLALTLTTVSTSRLNKGGQERRAANNAVRSIVLQIQALSDSEITNEAGWANTVVAAFEAGGAPGNTIVVPALDGAQDGRAVATIEVVTDETLTDEQLEAYMGMPRDLDGDGLATNTDVSASASLLPVIVRLNWNGPRGAQTLAHGFYLLGF